MEGYKLIRPGRANERRGEGRREIKRRVAQIITRMVPGGASRIVLDLIRAAPPTLEMTLIAGPEGLPPDLTGRLGPCPLIVLPDLVRAISPLRDLRALRALTRLLRKERFDAVHAHTSKAGLLGRLAAARARVPRIIYTPHGSIFLPESSIPGVPGSRILRRLLVLAERHAGKCSHLTTFLSKAERDLALELRLIEPGKAMVIPNGIDVDLFARAEERRSAARQRLGLSDGDLLVVAAGRLSAEKGHSVLLQSAASLLAEFPSLKLALCGEGPLKEELSRQAQRLFPPALAGSYGSAVLFLGLVEDMPAMLAAADVFAHPAHYEGFGLAPLEAMAAGLPVVATSVGGLPELISTGVDGILVTPGDREALASALRSLLSSPTLRQRLGERARSRARDFTLERMIASYIALYEEPDLKAP